MHINVKTLNYFSSVNVQKFVMFDHKHRFAISIIYFILLISGQMFAVVCKYAES